jgi:aminodeoxyfutalosine synthase
MLDNFDHVKSFWIMNTPAVTQLALWYGADDADGTVLEYEITYEDGAWGKKDQSLDPAGMVAMIREAGRVPIERDSLYNEVVRDEEPTPRRKRIPLPMSSS